MSHHVNRFYAAVSVLVAQGPIKQRLISAYQNHLDEIEDDELPGEVQKSFARLCRLMHSVAPANGEGPICASVRKMSGTEADDCAQLIVEIYGGVMRHSDAGQAVSPMAVENPDGVPPFLVKSG